MNLSELKNIIAIFNKGLDFTLLDEIKKQKGLELSIKDLDYILDSLSTDVIDLIECLDFESILIFTGTQKEIEDFLIQSFKDEMPKYYERVGTDDRETLIQEYLSYNWYFYHHIKDNIWIIDKRG